MSPLCPDLELEVPLEVKAACPVAVASLDGTAAQNILQRKCPSSMVGLLSGSML